MKQSKNQWQTPYIDYDGQWKKIVDVFFEPMTKFIMPELAADIDFSKAPELLKEELAKIIPEQTAKGRMSIDKLFKVPMKNGEYEHIFFHVEVESQLKVNFPKKNFKYFYRIFDSKDKAITALVIYASDRVPTPHDRYVYNFRGTELTYKFNTYLVRDADEEELLKSDNIFALVILTCKYINQTKNDFDLRRKFKLKLFRLALERNYPKKYIISLIQFINILMYLPPEIKQKFRLELKQESERIKQSKMGILEYIVMSPDEDIYEVIKEEYGDVIKAELKKEVEAELKKEVEAELKKEVEAEKKEKINIIRNLISSTSMQPTEIAQIANISVEEVLKIKAEIDK